MIEAVDYVSPVASLPRSLVHTRNLKCPLIKTCTKLNDIIAWQDAKSLGAKSRGGHVMYAICTKRMSKPGSFAGILRRDITRSSQGVQRTFSRAAKQWCGRRLSSLPQCYIQGKSNQLVASPQLAARHAHNVPSARLAAAIQSLIPNRYVACSQRVLCNRISTRFITRSAHLARRQ